MRPRHSPSGTSGNHFTATRSVPSKYYPDGADYPLMAVAIPIEYKPPSREITGSLAPFASRYYQIMRSPDTMTAVVSNVDLSAAAAQSAGKDYTFDFRSARPNRRLSRDPDRTVCAPGGSPRRSTGELVHRRRYGPAKHRCLAICRRTGLPESIPAWTTSCCDARGGDRSDHGKCIDLFERPGPGSIRQASALSVFVVSGSSDVSGMGKGWMVPWSHPASTSTRSYSRTGRVTGKIALAEDR